MTDLDVAVRPRAVRRRTLLWPFLQLAVLSSLAAWLLADALPPRLVTDTVQPRLDRAFPPLAPGEKVGQSFVARHPNLSAVELTVVVYATAETQPATEETLTFCLYQAGEEGAPLITVVTETARLKHNQLWRISFAPIRDSGGKAFTFDVQGSAGNRSSLWYSTFDAYQPGQLTYRGDSPGGDLSFSTYYAYDRFLFWHEFGEQLQGPFLTALLFLFLLLALGLGLAGWLLSPRREDVLTHAALAIAFSLALFPLLFLWTTAAGARVQPLWLRGLGLLAACLLMLRAWQARPWARRPVFRPDAHLVFGVVLLGLILLVRVIQVRQFVVPPGIDAPHHALITRLMATSGQVPHSFRPLLPIAVARYHFGFHSVAVALQWLTGISLTDTLLLLGQLLNATASLGVYVLASRLSGSRAVGLAAMLASGLVSVFPAYYANWGRFTVLAALTLLPGALVVLLTHLQAPSRRSLLLGGVLWSGLFLTHYQMLALGACFALIYLLVESRQRRLGGRPVGPLWWHGAQMAALVLLLAAPWLGHLAGSLDLAHVRTLLTLHSRYNVPNFVLLQRGHFGWLLLLALLATLLALRRRQRWVLLLWLWLALAFDIANWRALGMFGAFLLNNAAVVLILFVPATILVGYLGVELAGALKGMPLLQTAGLLCMAAAVGRAAWTSMGLIEPGVPSVTAAELEAMAWIERHTPPDAVFLVNSQVHGEDLLVTGPDGGVWLPAITGRRATLPPITYGQGAPAYQAGILALARDTAAAPTLETAGVQTRLTRHGVTHIFLGTTPGAISPATLQANPHVHLLFSNGAARVYAWDGRQPAAPRQPPGYR